MQVTKILGLAAVGALLALAAPAERANALSLSNPGAAAAVQEDAKLATTDVQWRHDGHHNGYNSGYYSGHRNGYYNGNHNGYYGHHRWQGGHHYQHHRRHHHRHGHH